MKQFGFVVALALGFLLITPGKLMGEQNHVISPLQIQNDVMAASAGRQQNLQQLQDSLSSPQVEQAMRAAHIDSRQVTTAVNQLNNEELAQLAARSAAAQADFSAGTMTDHDLLLILVGVAALILIIVAVR